jgi:rhodanese-related sulfurtransferase
MNLFTPRLLVPAFLVLAGCGAGDTAHEASLIDVAQAAARQDDRVNVVDLAGWLVEGRQDFALVDVRAAADYDKGHIGEAQNIPIAELVTAETLASLPADRKIFLYSNGSENGAKAATLLRMAGLDAYVVTGGYNAWHERVLNPDIPADEMDGESLEVSAQRALSCYFVGDRGAGSAERPAATFVPPVFTEEEDMDDEPLPPPGAESC